jgi:ribosomal protein L40E
MMFGFHGDMYNFLIIWIVLAFLLSIYVVNDAAKYGENGMLWGVIIFVMPMMGIIIYLVVRSTSLRQKSYSNTVHTTPPYREQYSPVISKTSLQKPNAKTILDGNESNLTKFQFCTSCGGKNSIEAMYCNSCGSKIIREIQ